MVKTIRCPKCGTVVKIFRNPVPTVDVIIDYQGKIVLVARKEPPKKLALPGGFVEYGESLETAVIREALEETYLRVENLQQFRAYSQPDRDPRQHNISMVFYGKGYGEPRAGSDAGDIILIGLDDVEKYDLAFDHKLILNDFKNYMRKLP